jgi:hypothetical protein
MMIGVGTRSHVHALSLAGLLFVEVVGLSITTSLAHAFRVEKFPLEVIYDLDTYRCCNLVASTRVFHAVGWFRHDQSNP